MLGGIAFALIRRRQFFSEKHRMKRFAGSSKLFMSYGGIFMKTWTKRLLCISGAAVFSFACISFSCAKTSVKGNAGTVYAESGSSIVP